MSAAASMHIERGVCHVMFAYDVGMSINLPEAERVLVAAARPETIRHTRRTPEYFGFENPPVRVPQACGPLSLGPYQTAESVEIALFEFGAVSVKYSIPIRGEMEDLLELTDRLYENAALRADSLSRVQRLVRDVASAIAKPRIAEFVEDYSIIHVISTRENRSRGFVERMVGDAASLSARVLRAERGELSRDEITDAMGARICFSPDDVLIVDWNGALMVGEQMDDVIAVLEYANVELLEMRYLDHRLDSAMERTSGARTTRGLRAWWPASLGGGAGGGGGGGGGAATFRALAELQVDGARLFEEVNNALKLLGDQYLARVYRLASQRLHLPEWDAAILRKLNTIESIYQKMNDFRTARRLETLEWIVILLIAVEVVLSLVRW
ncbi:MAG: hypothetical protein AB7G11_12585 [Phycisphaerales bacterium]